LLNHYHLRVTVNNNRIVDLIGGIRGTRGIQQDPIYASIKKKPLENII